jgi:hypothetical protein
MDLLSDLMHLANREGVDFEQVLEGARDNYLSEADGAL